MSSSVILVLSTILFLSIRGLQMHALKGWRSRSLKLGSRLFSKSKDVLHAETFSRMKSPLRVNKSAIGAMLLKTLVMGKACLAASGPLRLPMNARLHRPLSTIANSAVDPSIVHKRALDDRSYKSLVLENGLRVLLISDPQSSRSAAALDVHVGYFSDPKELPGLAHFCEHMTFLGTKKYPKEEEFSSFLSSNGGSSNAYTDSEDTVYFFDVNADHLQGALDRFGQFFVAPLFTESATGRELNAIESEHAKNINNDGFRLYQLDRDSANAAHPLNRFATGNKYTLETRAMEQGIDIRQRLLDFHRHYYSGNLMTLAVCGKQSLSELESYVKDAFSAVPNVKTADPATGWWGKVPPFAPQSAATAVEVVPIADSKSLTLSWPVWIRSAEEREALKRGKPDYVLSHLIGHEGEGSLRSALVKRGWINTISAYVGTDVSDCQKFDVHIELTDVGLQHRDDVTAMVFAYLDLLCTQYADIRSDNDVGLGERAGDSTSGSTRGGNEVSGLPQYLLDELRTLSHIAFDYAEKSDPSHYTSSVVTNMQQYPPALYLTGPQLFDSPDQGQIASYLQQLTPAAAMLTYVSPSYKNHTSLVANYYGTEHNNLTLTEETRRWSQVKAQNYPELSLPRPNILMPEKFDLLGADEKTTLSVLSEEEKRVRLMAPPALLRKDDSWEVWHKLDRSFGQPKVYVVISLAVPTAVHSPEFVVNSKLFSACFLDKINEFLYEARLAGLGLEFEFTSRGAQLTLSGFNDKMPLFAQQICAAMRTFTADQATYDRHKEQLQRELNSWTVQQPYYHASYFATLASETMQYSVSELIKALDKADIHQLDAYLLKILPKSYGKALVAGNADTAGAERLVRIVQETFPFTPLPLAERAQREISVVSVVPLSPANTASASTEGNTQPVQTVGLRLSNTEPNPNDENSAATFYFQLPSRLPTQYMYLELLSEVLEQPFYNDLRTQQQLGYIVYSGLKVREGVKYLAFVVQSSTISGAEISTKIEEFLRDKVPEILANLSENDLSVFKEGISVRKLEPDQRLTAQAGRFWAEIATASSNFDNHGAVAEKLIDTSATKSPLFNRAQVEVEALNAIPLSDFKSFVAEFLLVGGAKRRLLISQVTTTNTSGSAKAIKDEVVEQAVAVDGPTETTTIAASKPNNLEYVYKEVGENIAEYLKASDKM